MMRPCTTNPNLSYFDAMEVMYHFIATLIASFGTKTPIHVKDIRHQSWGYHAMQGWYFSPALKHYLVIKKKFIDTGPVRLTDTFKFKNHAIKIPTVNTVDKILKSTQALALTIQ